MKRIITHWTAGGYRATEVDREHYHILVEGDGALVRGDHEIPDNLNCGDGDYAAHVARLNTGSIGIAVCCMAGARRSPPDAGPYPMRREQYEVLAKVAADLCAGYGIIVSPRTVLGHGEVATILGVPQGGKWDPMVLPWNPATWNITAMCRHVGDAFRLQVARLSA